jgi:hypothetical protein
MFDPTVDSRPPTTIQEYDDIIERFIRLVFVFRPTIYIVLLTIFGLSAKPCTNLREEMKIGYVDLRVSLSLCCFSNPQFISVMLNLCTLSACILHPPTHAPAILTLQKWNMRPLQLTLASTYKRL